MIEKISVLVITRNREKMLSGCLNSIAKQTRRPNEVIVIDNASTDNTKKVILSFKKRLPIQYVQEKQIGIPYARNKGIQVTHGTLLLMLDDDCEADRFWVERMVNAHGKYPKAWAIQGRTYSLPQGKAYSLLAEFNSFIFVRNYSKTTLPLKTFFHKYFKDEMHLLTCDTKNFSIKTSYLKKYKIFFDENFYRAEDIDLGKQITQNNGIIIFCPSVTVGHWERSNLPQFLEQRWHIGRSEAKIADKWRTPSLPAKITFGHKTLLACVLFCKISNQWVNLPVLIALIFLDRLCRLNGYFFEKRILALAKP